jgi:O-antigen/teichoic acid export membrane protein
MKKNIMNFIKKYYNFKNPVINKLINGMAWNVIGTILSKVLVMVASILTARILGADKNGEYSVINSTVLMFSTFAGLGLGITATRFVAEYKSKDRERCGRIIGMTNIFGFLSGFIMAVTLILLAPWLAKEQLNAPYLDLGLRLASILLITNTINTIQVNTLSGFDDFKSIAKLSVIQGIISCPIFVIFTYLFKVNGLILGHIFVSCIMLILYGIVNYKTRKKHGISIDIKGINQEAKILWKFSMPSLLSNVMVGPVTWLGNTFITSIENGYFELGVFNAANQWRTALTFIPTAVGNVILPLIIANKGDDRLERINILLGWVIVICIAIPLLAFPEIITFLYGDEYMGQTFNISILMIILVCCILSYKEGISRNLMSNNLMWWAFLSNTLWGISFLLILWGIRDKGAIGLATAYLIAYTITTIIFVPFYIRRGIVHRSLIISKEIVLMWVTLFIQMIGTILISNVFVRVATLLVSLFSLWNVIKMMLKKEKLC